MGIGADRGDMEERAAFFLLQWWYEDSIGDTWDEEDHDALDRTAVSDS